MDTVDAGRALAREYPVLRIIVSKLLHADANDSPNNCSEAERRNEQAAGNLDAKREDRQDKFDDQRENKKPNSLENSRPCSCNLNRLINVREVSVVVAKKKQKKFNQQTKQFKLNKADDSPYRVATWNSALTEEQENQLAGIHASVRIWESNDGGDERDTENFSDWILAELAVLAELAPEDVGFDEESSDTSTDDSKSNEGNQLDKDPGLVVFDEKEDGMFIAEWIDRSQDESSNEGAEERSPKGLEREIVRNLFQTEENTTDWSTEGNRNASRRCSW